MIDLLKKLAGIGKNLPDGAEPPVGQDSGVRDVHLAACAVFLEMAEVDNEFDGRERDHILTVFENQFGLAPEDVVGLKKAAVEAVARSKDYWTFTNVINQHYTNDEKCRLAELLWELVYADGRMDEHENYLMHKLAKLLRLTHRDLINAKLEVLHRNDRKQAATDGPTGPEGGGE